MSNVIALTRSVSPAMADCELTHMSRVPIDVALAAKQHAAYERALETLGCSVHRLPSTAEIPDAVFIEDMAVALDEIAVIMRPGAASRRHEIAEVAEWLKHRMLLARIEAPGTMDGDDVLLVNRGWVPDSAFKDFELVDVHPSEPSAANVVHVGSRLLYSAAFPWTLERLRERNLQVTTVDVGELAKAEGAVTCCSVIMNTPEN